MTHTSNSKQTSPVLTEESRNDLDLSQLTHALQRTRELLRLMTLSNIYYTDRNMPLFRGLPEDDDHTLRTLWLNYYDPESNPDSYTTVKVPDAHFETISLFTMPMEDEIRLRDTKFDEAYKELLIAMAPCLAGSSTPVTIQDCYSLIMTGKTLEHNGVPDDPYDFTDPETAGHTALAMIGMIQLTTLININDLCKDPVLFPRLWRRTSDGMHCDVNRFCLSLGSEYFAHYYRYHVSMEPAPLLELIRGRADHMPEDYILESMKMASLTTQDSNQE